MNAINLLHELQNQGVYLAWRGGDFLDVEAKYQIAPSTLEIIKSNKLVLIGELQKRVYHGFTIEQLKTSANEEDWQRLSGNNEALASYALSLKDSLLIKSGKKPSRWTQASRCRQCGDIKLWDGCPSYVLACPFCNHKNLYEEQ